MANKKYHSEGPSAEDKALDLFADMMIEKIKNISDDWKKPWFTEGSLTWPRNLDGREYNGMNAIMLTIHSENEGYKLPVFGTFKRISDLNFSKDKQGERQQRTDKNGEPLPQVKINKGEKSFPVFLTTFTVVNKETKERIKYDDYKRMSDEQRKEYNVFPKLQVYNVFNVAQTNIQESRPELYKKLEEQAGVKKPEHNGEEFSFPAMDKMIKDNEWICPINPVYGDRAFFSLSKNEIVVPEKQQFVDGEAFYTSLFHEMAHSTGHESQLGRLKTAVFGSPDYAREELVAELTAALTGQRYGMVKHINSDSAAYLKSWLGALSEEPKYIKNVLLDVKKASQMMNEHIDRVALEVGETQSNVNKQEEKEDLPIAQQPSSEKKPEPVYYASVAYLQSTDDTQRFDSLVEQEDYKGLLAEASNYDQGEPPDLEHTYLHPKQNIGDDLLDEDDNYAVVYNASVGGTYEIFAKISEEQVKDNLIRYGLSEQVSADVANVAATMKEFSETKSVAQEDEVTLKKAPAPSHPLEPEPSVDAPQDYFNALMKSVTDENHEGHTALDISSIDELREYFRDHGKLGEWIMVASDQEIMEAGASLLPKLQNSPSVTMAESSSVNQKEQSSSPHEDSNPQTDVASIARDIAETGVSMTEAEKAAKAIADDKAHQDRHQIEEKMEQEKKNKEKKSQEAKQSESNAPQKALVQAGLLLSALVVAKESKGVWMNKAEKANAQFLISNTPITAFNNLMLNLASDQKGYRTNVFEFHNVASKGGVDVKHGEKATPFNWVRWDYQNVTNKQDTLTKAQYEQLPDDKKAMYEKFANRQTQHVFNVDQTTFNAVDPKAYSSLVKTSGTKEQCAATSSESAKENEDSSIMKQWQQLKSKHPDTLLLFRAGDFYETYKNDAVDASRILGITLTKHDKGYELAGFPHHAPDTYLPKLIRAGHRIVICDQMEAPTATKAFKSEEAKAIIDKANSVAKDVMAQVGGKYERVMVLQPAMYDKAEDKIVVSGIKDQTIGDERQAAIAKANDIYRAVVGATGTENRLDRSGRNNLLPEDDAKHETLIRELAAGVLMARQGLPATLSKDSQKLIPYWEREIKENPKFVDVIERDVNNAVETIDSLLQKRKVNYEAIRGLLPSKTPVSSQQSYAISTDLAKLPSAETKEVVVVKDPKAKTADVILPAGASVEANNEISGMRKDRIASALRKDGIENVKFYNAGGYLALKKPNEYFQDKDVALAKLKQYQLLPTKEIDVKAQAKPTPKVEIEKFLALKGENGRYAFFIKPKDEPSFSVYPPKEHMNKFFNVLNTPEQKATHAALAEKWYEIATQEPSIKQDLITPRKVDVDMSKIERPTITSSAEDKNKKIVVAYIDGKRETAPITKDQWNKMWLADNMADYKKGVAAIAFEPLLKRGEQVSASEKEQVGAKEQSSPKQEEPSPQQTEEESRTHGMHR